MRFIGLSALLALAAGAVALPSLVSRADECTVPSWQVTNLTVWYSSQNSGPNSGRTTFTISSNFGTVTETLSCQLPFNSHCQIYGTPKNPKLTVLVMFAMDKGQFTLVEDFECTKGEK
jgi:hypothetical protein